MLNASLILPTGSEQEYLKIIKGIKGIRWNSLFIPNYNEGRETLFEIPIVTVHEMLPYNNELLFIFDKSFCNYDFLSESIRNSCHLFIEETSVLSGREQKDLSVLSSEGGTAIQVRNDFLHQPLVERSMPLIKDSQFTDIRQLSCNSDLSIINLLYQNLSLLKKYNDFPINKIDVAGAAGIENANVLNLRIEFTNGSVAMLTVSPKCSDSQHSITLFGNDRIATADFISNSFITDANSKEKISNIEPAECLNKQLNNFVNNITSKSEVTFSMENDLEVHELMLKVFEKLKFKSITT